MSPVVGDGVLRLKREINPQSGLSTYDALVVWHVRAMMTMTPPTQGSRNAAHRGRVFLPWHRYLLIVYEQQLQRVLQDDGFGLPYWAWNRDGDLPPEQQTEAPIWGTDCMGGSGDPVTTGPFANPTADPGKFIVRVESNSMGQLVTASRGLARSIAGDISTLPTTAQARAAVDLDIYDEPNWGVESSITMRNVVEGWKPDPPGMHNRVHVWIGGDMAPASSPNDPAPVVLPESGLAISAMLAQILGVRVGDFVEVDLLEAQRRTVSVPVAALVEDYFGIKGMMDAEALSRLMREAPVVNSVHLSVDVGGLDPLYEAIKAMPTVSGMALQRASLANFRRSLALLVTTMGSIYTGLAAIIAFGVIYNSARIALSERARDLASLRVLGFTRGEVLRILFLELALLTLIAQPPGWAMGYGLAWLMKTNLAGELMRVRLVVEHSTYVTASLMVIVAAALSALVVRRRVNRLDLVAVLKTRD